ncbi:hypothetical protein FB567DRAFT_437333 [Paraphoma chrysanthemicola]|uniref:Uncharacterized protein n=1 Tax=Paraphoma chrysanthemicola TaxID=798071 RepID=A0A8K0RDB0_9PLEO|nr:hypothetical protein FB567DRAFT_437333 [Paraphoma chrysanthemicola]
MDSPLPIVRPWTPPDTDLEPSPRSDYFSDPFRPPSSYSPDDEKHWAHLPSRSDASAQMEPRCDTPTEAQNHARPKPVERVTDPAPYTPTKNLNYGHADANGALRYPYTPDSSRILRRSTELPSSPPSWDEYSEHSSSPVQNALSSCIAHFENLIQSQQPDEDQMEYIVAQFEAMTSFLSAPDAQTRKTDDHLFSEPDQPPTTGLGISTADDARAAKLDHMSQEAHDAYVAEVGAYISGVKSYIQDLKMRLDEVKMLNSIQLDVINDLRRQMKSVRRNMRSSLDMREDVKMVEEELERIAHEDEGRVEEFGLDSWETLVDEERAGQSALIPKDQTEEEDVKVQDFVPGRRRIIHIVRKPERRSFWSSFGEALDSFGELFLDY